MLTPLRQSADDLMFIIVDLIELSALEAGHVKPMASPFAACELLESLLARHRAAAAARNLELSEAIDPSLPTILIGYIERLRQVFAQLLSNAIKFTEHGKIAISGRLAERTETQVKIEFCIEDTGPGIPPEKLKLLGGLLTQVDESSNRRHGGLGVALPIARKLIEVLGGELRIASEVGVGSRFCFTLPFTLPAAGQQH